MGKEKKQEVPLTIGGPSGFRRTTEAPNHLTVGVGSSMPPVSPRNPLADSSADRRVLDRGTVGPSAGAALVSGAAPESTVLSPAELHTRQECRRVMYDSRMRMRFLQSTFMDSRIWMIEHWPLSEYVAPVVDEDDAVDPNAASTEASVVERLLEVEPAMRWEIKFFDVLNRFHLRDVDLSDLGLDSIPDGLFALR